MNRLWTTPLVSSMCMAPQASSVGGVLLVVVVLLLACVAHMMARYHDYIRRMKHRAATILKIIKPSCLA